MEKTKVTLTKQQEEAIDLIKKWYKSSDDQLFVLGGYAGTGKTFLVKEAARRLKINPDRIAYITPTGKSAEVLVAKGIPATTLHRVIYSAIEHVETKTVNGETVKVKTVDFIKKSTLDVDYELLILDEFSMVSDQVIKDLMSYNIKILACGDPMQLMPVQGTNSYFNKMNYVLTDIVRQGNTSPIVLLASEYRQNNKINPNNYPKSSIIFLKKSDLTDDDLKKLYMNVDQIICGKNSTKIEIDKRYRTFKGIPETQKLPLAGEKVIALVNNWGRYLDKKGEFNLVNGTVGTLAEDAEVVQGNHPLGTLRLVPNYKCNPTLEPILFDTGAFTDNMFSFDMHEKAFILPDGSFVPKKFAPRKAGEPTLSFKQRTKLYALIQRISLGEVQINRFQFAYGITCHKSQGSEWDSVLIYDESKSFGNEASKWMYTAVTRAKKKVIIIMD